jgi:hypothetical protein
LNPQRIDFRIAGVIFGWLVGVAAFALAFPVWLTITLALAALVSAMIWRSHRRGRASARAIAAVAIVGGITYVALNVGPFASAPERRAPETEEGPRPGAGIETVASSLGSGQFGAGEIVRASLGDASGAFPDLLSARLGSTVTVAIRLSNVGPDPVVGTRVVGRLPDDAASSLSVGLSARARNTNPYEVGDTATIELADDAEACPAYVPGSSRLFDQHFGLIRGLPDGVTEDGVTVGSVGVGVTNNRFFGFEVRLEDPGAGGECG